MTPSLVLRCHEGNDLSPTRDAVRKWAIEQGLPPSPLDLIVTELTTNGLAARRDDEPVEITVQWSGGTEVEVRVADHGPAFSLPRNLHGPPAPSQRGGRGLYIVAHLCNDLTVEQVGNTTVVSARLPQYRYVADRNSARWALT